MPASLESQRAALRAVCELRPDALVRAGLARRSSDAEIIRNQLQDAARTFGLFVEDERCRRYIEQKLRS